MGSFDYMLLSRETVLDAVNFEKEDDDDTDDDYKHSNKLTCSDRPMAKLATINWLYPQFTTANDFSSLPSDKYKIESDQKWITYPGKRNIKFPLRTILPKVQRSRMVKRKECPRDVEVDRKRRKYAKLRLVDLLEEAGVQMSEELQPITSDTILLTDQPKHFLPLEIFDDNDYLCYTPEFWLSLGFLDGIFYPLPGWAYLPTDNNDNYQWEIVAVDGYDDNTSRWLISDLNEGRKHRLPGIQLMFIAENPRLFVKRIQHAIRERNSAENNLRFQFIVDCVVYSGGATITDFETKLMLRIKKLMISYRPKSRRIIENYIRIIEKEAMLVVQRTMAVYEFEKFLLEHQNEFPTIDIERVQIGITNDKHKRKHKKIITQDTTTQNKMLSFTKIRDTIRVTTLFYTHGAIYGIFKVVEECAYVESLSLFSCSWNKALSLKEFTQSQTQSSWNTIKYLKTTWPENLINQICMHLRTTGVGWLDLTVSKWSVYHATKLVRFMFQVKLRMQETLQVLLEKSILNYSKMLNEPCNDFLNLNAETFEWPANDLINSPFQTSRKTPVFYLELILSETNAHYSSTPNEVLKTVVELFYNGLMQTTGIRVIDSECLLNLHYARNLYLLTVELIEDLYVEHKKQIIQSYSKVAIPLNAFAKCFERFLPLRNINANTYIADFAAAKKQSWEVGKEIVMHRTDEEELRTILPSNIIIGPFFINTDPLKQYLVNKRIELVRRLFQYYLQRMETTNENLLERFIDMDTRLNDKSQSIEQIFDTKDFMLKIPDILDEMQKEIDHMMEEYKLLDQFHFELPDGLFVAKWEVVAWPEKIIQLLPIVRERHKSEIEDFKRMQAIELLVFEDELDTLNDEVKQYGLKFDPSYATEVSIEVKKTTQRIAEARKVGKVLQTRQVLFDDQELSLEFLEQIIIGFKPYKYLWLACGDFLKLEEATTGNSIANIDVEDVRNSLENLKTNLQSSFETFNEKEEIQAIAQAYIDKIEAFHPIVNAIECVKSPNWTHLHWKQFATNAGIDIKYSLTINFSYCIKKGILKNLNLLFEMSERAEAEAERKILEEAEAERLRIEQEEAMASHKELRKCRTDIL